MINIYSLQYNRKHNLKFIEKGCDDDHGSGQDAPELGMGNVGGVFLVLITGLGIAFFVGILEFFWNVSRVAVEEVVNFFHYTLAKCNQNYNNKNILRSHHGKHLKRNLCFHLIYE